MSRLTDAIEELQKHSNDPEPYMTMEGALLFVAAAAERDLDALRNVLGSGVPPCGDPSHEWDNVDDQGFQRCTFCGVLRPVIAIKPASMVEEVIDTAALREAHR